MKNLLILLPVVWLCSCASQPQTHRNISHEGIVPEINAAPTLQFLGESYAARYSAFDSEKAIVNYYRAGDGEKSWEKLLSLQLNLKGANSRQLAENMEKSVKAGGASAVRTFQGQNKNEYGLEFTIMSQHVVELDVFRFMNRPNGSGTISFQYAEKIPSEQLRKVGQAKLPEYYAGIRSKVVKEMESVPMPGIEIVMR